MKRIKILPAALRACFPNGFGLGLMASAVLWVGFGSPSVGGAETNADDRIRIAVYEGGGVGASCGDLLGVLEEAKAATGLEIMRINGDMIRQGRLSEVDVLIHPGGSGGGQARDLQEEGREAVRRFVKEGGGYVGVCAGAYLATNHYSWSLGLIDAKVLDTKHWARGTGMVAVELSASASQFFRTAEKEIEIFYAQGPLLTRPEWEDPDVPDYESLAVYRTGIAKKGAPEGIMPGSSAIIRASHGKGRVFCFSPHPELTDSLGNLLVDAVVWVSGKTMASPGDKPSTADR